MRLYALLFALFVLRTRAASIPESAEIEKKIQIPDVVFEKTENTSSEQELIDQTNTIKDVENNLRVKLTEDIPVAVIVENPEPILKISEETDDIVRPEPDLNNPGPPQRQLHETQNPEYHEGEQQSVLSFNKNINDAQIVLRQGFQGVSDGIQHIYENTAQLKAVQKTIESLRDGFTSQINKLNDTINHFLNPENPNNEKSSDEESKTGYQKIETGLNSLKSDFNRGVQTLAEGVDVVASLKDDAENTDSVAAEPSVPTNLLLEYMQNLQNIVTMGFSNLTQAVLNQAQGQGSQPESTTTVVSSNSVQSDTPVSSTTQQVNPFQAGLQNIQNVFSGLFNNTQGQQAGGGPFQPIANIQNQITQFFNPNNSNQGTPATPVGVIGSGSGPIIQGIQNNPIVTGFYNLFRPNSQSPASSPSTVTPANNAVNQVVAVSPVAPAKQLGDVEKQNDADSAEVEAIKEEVVKKVEEEIKGGFYGPGPNRPGSGSGIKPDVVEIESTSLVAEDTLKHTVPEEPKKEVKVEEKSDQTDNKTDMSLV